MPTDKAERNRENVTAAPMTREMLRMLKVIRTHRDMTVDEALDKYGGPGVSREYRRCVEEMKRDLGESGA